ncbi:MAG: MBL fold metallo-hydrolase [Polyangiaceae bacterium]|nr:MBL fold metallo-hydrolase [Polyangiaceae bacterium]
MRIQPFHDPATCTLTYVVFDPATKDAVVIDSVLDYDPLKAETSTRSAERVAAFLDENELRVPCVLETHAHADHLSAAQWLKHHYGSVLVIGERIRKVQKTFRALLDLGEGFPVDGSQFDYLVKDGEILTAGSLRLATLPTPGHTAACVSYKIDDAVFTGDALFMDDYGTGRCDFPGGSAEALYHSVHGVLYALPDETRVFPCHDYQPGGREVRYETSIGKSKSDNVQLRADTTQDDYVAFREKRDATLAQPKLLYPSIQVNIAGGRLPEAHANGTRYLVMPLNLAHPTAEDGARA